MSGSKVMMSNESHHTPPKMQTRRMRAYLMLVIDVLTFRASAIALTPSASRLGLPYPPERLQDQGHDEILKVDPSPPPMRMRKRSYLMSVIDVLTFSASPIALPPSAPSLLPPRLEK